ncbi:MAG: anthranilate synthase component I family protein [Marinilabiliales bacterium]|nr:anthranilate synthase component I family protein [Marinilabiliales bacterium]
MKEKIYQYNAGSKQIPGDLHTPVGTYLKIRDVYPESVLLESSDFHAGENSLSYLALKPIARIGINGGKCLQQFPDGTERECSLGENFGMAEALQGFLDSFAVSGAMAEACGLFGYTSFDAVRYLEKIPVMEVHQPENDAPDLLYLLYKYILVFNHYKDELTLIELTEPGEPSGLQELETLIANRNFASYDFNIQGEERSTLTDEQYKAIVSKGIAHCLRGDVFQVVLSRRFEQPFLGDDFKVYRALRNVNPSPYLFYFDFGGFRIFGSSPETHCRVSNGRATIDPIAGTVRRQGNAVQDKALSDALLKDPKENAEHVMLVDLARNDLSRNCEEVGIDFYKAVHYYSHVIHLVSRVSGKIVPESNPVKTFLETFPAGTLSGAPKVRAMELISELEPHNRGAYGGCIGFIGFNGDLNQAITIRSFVSRGNVLHYQAGAGIVAKSKEENELQEVNNKLGALKRAIDLARNLKN